MCHYTWPRDQILDSISKHKKYVFLSPPSGDRLEMDVSSERATLHREWLRNALYSKHQPSPDVLSFVPNASNNIQRSENCKTRTAIAIMADVHFVKCFTPAAEFKTLPKAQRTRGLSSYHKLLHKSWSNNFRILIKHLPPNLKQTSVSRPNLNLKS